MFAHRSRPTRAGQVGLVGLVGAAALTALVATVPAGPAHAAASGDSGAREAVTWNGWRGVSFGETFTRAHHELGGRLTRVNPGGGCGDVLEVRTGSLDGDGYARSHRVGTVIVDEGIAYPLGVDATMRPARIERIVRQHGYEVSDDAEDVYGTGDVTHLETVAGPRGHTLWFAYLEGDTHPYRMGLSINRRVARQQLTQNGC